MEIEVMNLKKKILLVFMSVCIFISVTGCQKVIFTTSNDMDYVVAMGSKKVSYGQAMMIVMTLKSSYEKSLSDEMKKDLWDEKINDDTTFGAYLRDENAMSEILALVYLNSLKSELNIEITDAQKQKIKSAAEEYYNTLTDDEKAYTKATVNNARRLMEDYYVAKKVITELSKNVPKEISDDEARVAVVQSILIPTVKTEEKGKFKTDDSGNLVSLSAEEKKAAFTKAQECLEKAKDGENFDTLTQEYSKDNESKYEVHRGEFSQNFEEAAYSLEAGAISDIIETEYGYHILKSVTPYDKDLTEDYKSDLLQKLIYNSWFPDFEKWVQTASFSENKSLWNSISITTDLVVENCSLYEIYYSKLTS